MAPSSRPATTGYERLAQADQFSDDSEDEGVLTRSYASLQPAAAPRYAPITQPRPRSGMTSPKASSSRYNANRHHRHSYHYQRPSRRTRSNSGVDLKAINARLERWADEIASKFKRSRAGKDKAEEEHLEIQHSVFQAPEGVRPVTAENLAAYTPPEGVMSKAEFEAIVESVRTAIEQGVHPKMISKGSSGSYFARNAEGKVVGVFKPKDEEPYAAGNPKWNKWIHRNLFPCCFGRACLIPNLSYVSEAAAYVLDCQLRTCLVPYTDVVYLSSKSFHYPFWDRHSFHRRKKPLPAKPGSFQVFLKGYKDANIFLREHPWPDQYLSGFRTSDTHRNRRRRWADSCRPSSSPHDNDSDDGREGSNEDLPPGPDNFVWTDHLKQSFREQLERLVILDYIMRNTDRGLDNWMIRVDWETEEVSIASEPVQLNMRVDDDDDEAPLGPRPVDLTARLSGEQPRSHPYPAQKPMDLSGAAAEGPRAKVRIGAIDNSLSWPWKHPDAWRSFPFGWLFLPVDLIGRPFSQSTRDHFLPLLTSTHWWSQTQLALRRVFQLDPDFQERMFARQMAVMKGQAWNVVETLKTEDHGPLELTRRAKVCVWDDLVDVPVAVPMRATSAEMRRRHTDEMLRHGHGRRRSNLDEMDIGAVNSSPSKQRTASKTDADSDTDALLGDLATPPGKMPRSGRFDSTSAAAPPSLTRGETDPQLPPPAAANGSPKKQREQKSEAAAEGSSRSTVRPGVSMHSKSDGATISSSLRGAALNMYAPDRERRFSFASVSSQPRNGGKSIAQALYGSGRRRGGSSAELGSDEDDYDDDDDYDDIEGDLGYAAAEGMEGNRRKVIVERLEAVKSKNPVFSCC